MLCIAIILKYRVHIVYFIKIKVLIYTSHKEHCEVYTEIYGLIAVNSCHIELERKDIILVPDTAVTLYKVCSGTGVQDRDIKFTLSAGTCSIDEFSTKIKAEVLQQMKDLEVPQIKDLKLVIREYYIFMTSNSFFIELGIPENYPENNTRVTSTIPLSTYKTSLDISPPPKLLSLHCKQTNRVRNEVDGPASSLLA